MCATARLRPTPSRPIRKDRKSTRLNSSHGYISYAVFCLKKNTTTSTLPAHFRSVVVLHEYDCAGIRGHALARRTAPLRELPAYHHADPSPSPPHPHTSN